MILSNDALALDKVAFYIQQGGMILHESLAIFYDVFFHETEIPETIESRIPKQQCLRIK